MIVAIVTFSPRHRTTLNLADQRRLFEATAPTYQQAPGLLRKYYIGNESRAGGIYEWRSRAHADAFYTDDWRKRITDTYGTELRIEWFDAPCIVDNDAGRIIFDPALDAAGEVSSQ